MEGLEFEISSVIFDDVNEVDFSDCSLIENVSEDTFDSDLNLKLKKKTKKFSSKNSLKNFLGEDLEIKELKTLIVNFQECNKENFNNLNNNNEEKNEILSILKKPNRYNSCFNINNRVLIKPIIKKGLSNLDLNNKIERVSNPLFKRYSSN